MLDLIGGVPSGGLHNLCHRHTHCQEFRHRIHHIHHAELGHLSVGAVADIAVMRIDEGKFGYLDSNLGRYEGKQRMACELTVRAGTVSWDWNGRVGTDYKLLGPDYGIRPVEYLTRPPK